MSHRWLKKGKKDEDLEALVRKGELMPRTYHR
jgi:hypothetical protein